MKKLIFPLLVALISSSEITAQDYKRAPNSYIFDSTKPLSVKGLYIPVIKAYKMWEQQEYLFTSGSATPIPAGAESASLVWEDQPGLIRSLSITGSGSSAKIKVEVDRSKGKGNAVVAYKVNGTTYWSWHVWVVDDPGNSNYSKSPSPFYAENDINGLNKGGLKFMDRNLGALSNTFLGNEWNKSAGLSYQEGRKDPYPNFVHKDLQYYEVGSNDDPAVYRHQYFAQLPGYSTTFNTVFRTASASTPDLVNDFVKFSVNNPLRPILPPSTQTSISPLPWYSNVPFKSTGSSSVPDDDTTHDMWNDNMAGYNLNPYSDSKKMKLKSPYDPCPNGWRVPSWKSQRNKSSYFSPWGRDSGDTLVTDIISPTATHVNADNIKFYPALGVDFGNSTGRTYGKYSNTGKYEYRKLDIQSNYNPSFYKQDVQSEVNLFSATLTGGGEQRSLTIINDVARFDKNNGLGSYVVSASSTSGHAGLPVKCVKDFNYLLTTIGTSTVQNYDFPTEYFSDTMPVDFQDGLNLPNSYVLQPDGTDFKFPILKALSVYNQYLSDHKSIPSTLRANILWTTDKQLITNIKLNNSCNDLTRAYIEIKRTNGIKGNALISLEDTISGRIYWSWHIWVPDGDPTNESTGYLYTTENERPMVNTVGYTNSGAPPLTTRFMDRNLGAIYAFPSNITNLSTDATQIDKAKKSIGLFYQWGRKDPLNSFEYAGNSGPYAIYKPNIDFNSANSTYGDILSWNPDITSLPSITNQASMVQSLSVPKAEKISRMLEFSAKNPTSLLVENASNDWLSSIGGWYSERWGHADTKSVFDPCPDGWRVPDFSFLNWNSLRQNNGITGQDAEARGTSPWYFANGNSTTTFNFNPALVQSSLSAATKEEIKTAFRGVPQSLPYNVSSVYGGTKKMRTASDVFGWVFSNNTNGYVIGDYPNSKGLNIDNNSILAGNNFTALWSAAPEVFQRGEAKAMVINNDNMYSGTIVDFTTDQSQSFKPQIALNVRCVKQLDMYRGDNGTIEVPPTPCPASTMSTAENNRPLENLEIYPVPTEDVLHLQQVGKYTYEIYDVSGKKLQSGRVIDQEISLRNLPEGIYVLVIENDQQQKTTKKIIKK